MKAIRLTSQKTAMHLVIQGSCDRVVPRQRFGPSPQFFMGTTLEQGAQTIFSYREVVKHLQYVKQHGDGHRV